MNPIRKSYPWVRALCLWVLAGHQAMADELVDGSVIQRFRIESMERSQVAETLSYLSDIYGPRLSGTPRYLEMVHWVEQRLQAWGVEATHLETYGDGHRGWEIVSFSAAMTAPVFMDLNAHPICCSRGTGGSVSGKPVLVDFYDLELLKSYRGRLKGKILLHPELVAEAQFHSGKWSDEKLQLAAQRSNPVTPDGLDGPGSAITYLDRLRRQEESAADPAIDLAQFLIDEGVVAVVRSSSAPAGLVNNRFEPTLVEFNRVGDPKPVPLFVIPREQHGRLLVLAAHGASPILSLNLDTRFYEEPSFHVNLIAEIPGLDQSLKDEIVMLGAHLDSVALGTGAADNGIGAATAMEVMRMFTSLHLKPRRTIRLALWGGEERDLQGSSAWVKRHVGDLLTANFSGEQELISAYFNHDNNGHDIRGIFLVGHEAIRPIFRAFFEPFKESGAAPVTIEHAGGTDLLVFDATGIPSFEWIHDPGQYFSHQLHTNLDMTALVDIDSVRRNSVIIASAVYHTAMRNDRLPRTRPAR
jgi:hypothetical protein